MKKKLVYFCMLSLLSVLLLAGCKGKEKSDNPYYDSDNYLTGTYYAVIDVQDYGEIYLVLYAGDAPATVTNFVNLVEDGFYNGLTFHRVIDGFMIQGGDPEGDGTGKAEYTIPGEFSENGFANNNTTHARGIISMARAKDYDSASCQFFIMQEDTPALDGYYATFGRVLSGMDVVDAICAAVPVEDDNGTVLSENQPVINSITMIEKEEVPTSTPKKEIPESAAHINIYNLQHLTAPIPSSASMVLNEGGRVFHLLSSKPLSSISVYKVDLANGVEYGEENLIAQVFDFTVNTFLALTMNVPEDLSLLLVAEEPDGTIIEYSIGYNEAEDVPYLIPIL